MTTESHAPKDAVDKPWRWPSSSISARLVIGLLAALLMSGTALVALTLWLGQRAARAEHEQAAGQLVQLFETSLQNAMLQRDLDSLERILSTLGQAPGISQARLLDTNGQVRFASRAQARGEKVVLDCTTRGCVDEGLHHRWLLTPQSRILQTTYPIRNRTQCIQCHGDPAVSPVNGVLLVDFSPQPLVSNPMRLAWLLALAAALMTFGSIMAWTIRRLVVRPLHTLASTSDRFARGQLDSRVRDPGEDEIGQLGQHFNAMADQVAGMVTRLQAQQAFLQDLVNGIPDPVLVIGPEWKIRIANSAYSELIGLEPGMPVDGTCYRVGRGLDAPCPNTLVSCPHAITLSSPGTLAGKGESSTRTVMTLRHRDGHDIPVEIDSARLTCEGQVFTVEVLRPLNEAIRFSQEMRLSTIGLLANGVAHEIHNPLASIRLALQASLRELKRQHVNTAELTGYLQVVDSQIDRCVATTQRLMQMSALPNEELVPVSLGSALEDVTTLLREDARQRHVHIECLPQVQDVWLMADPAELRQIFFNLLHNAMNALPHGGRVQINGEPTPDGHAYRLRVSDTGVGIAPENLARVFLPFFSRRADGRAGMGLGLAVCKSIVDRFGGAIEVRSELGQGSTFTVTIPMASTRPSPGDERGAEPRVSTQLP